MVQRRSSPAGGGPGAYRGRPAGEGDRDTGSPGQADAVERAREVCLRLLAVRPRTRAELATALRRRHIADEVAEVVLDRFGEVGMIDDALFAQAWVTSRHYGRGLARRALGHELRRKGVDSATVGDALEHLDPATEEQTARSLVERKLRGIGGAPPDVVLRRLTGMLARKGYPPGLAFRVIREALEARPEIVSFLEETEVDLDAVGQVADADGVILVAEDRYEPDT